MAERKNVHLRQAEVFMIESLTYADENADKYEGEVITQILKLNDKKPIYYYIRTKKELISVLKTFEKSNYRYLHISCHANNEEMGTTLDSIPFEEFSSIVKPHLAYKRLFVSACEMVNDKLARLLLPKSRCYSILGPCKSVSFSSATILWSSFYHLMFNHDSTAMKGDVLRDYATQISGLYEVPLNYFWWSTKSNRLIKREIRPNK